MLSKALESAEYGAAGERTTYGNPLGRELLEDRHDMKEMMKRLEGKVNKMEEEIANSKAQITDLQHRVKVLTVASEGYRNIRHRFLDVYRRDILRDLDKQGLKYVGVGNAVAHEGDAITDAELYTSGDRHDEPVLIDLYGLKATQISYLGKCRTSS